MVSGDVDRDALIKSIDRALHRFEAFPDAGSRLRRSAAADGPRSGEMVIDLPPHHERLAADGCGKVVRMRGRGVGDYRQRCLERMGKIARVTPRFFGLFLAVRQQLVDFLGQRTDFGRKIGADARLFTRTNVRRRRAGPASAATDHRKSGARQGSAIRRQAR